MAKRLQLDFHTASAKWVEENGQPRPCAMGVPWVNADTLETLAQLDIPRTDPWGRPLPAGNDGAGTSAPKKSVSD